MLWACDSGGTSDLSWSVAFEAADARAAAVLVIASIDQGPCAASGSTLYRATVRDGGGLPLSPSRLPAGTYAFRATARDGTCQEIATGCETVVLPRSTPLTVMLRAAGSTAACAADSCSAGACGSDPPDTTMPPVVDAGACVPSCAGKTCGPDGCGGICGRCGTGSFCLDGRCDTQVTPGQCPACAADEFCDKNQGACRGIPSGCGSNDCICIAGMLCSGPSACTFGDAGLTLTCL